MFDGDYTWGKTIPDFCVATVAFALFSFLNTVWDLRLFKYQCLTLLMSDHLLQNRLLLLRERATYLQRMEPPRGANRKRLLSMSAD